MALFRQAFCTDRNVRTGRAAPAGLAGWAGPGRAGRGHTVNIGHRAAWATKTCPPCSNVLGRMDPDVVLAESVIKNRHFARCKLPTVADYNEMVSILENAHVPMDPSAS